MPLLADLQLVGEGSDGDGLQINSVIPRLFSDVYTTDKKECSSLRWLELQRFNLDNVLPEVLSFLNVNFLSDLSFDSCDHIDSFLRRLESPLESGGSRLRTISMHTWDELDEASSKIVSKILDACTDLDDIHLLMPRAEGGDPRLPWDGIMKHGSALRSLALNTYIMTDDHQGQLDSFSCVAARLEHQLPNLKDLSASLPALSMPFSQLAPTSEAIICLGHLARLPALRALRVYDWPDVPLPVFDGIPEAEDSLNEMQQLMNNRYDVYLDDFAIAAM